MNSEAEILKNILEWSKARPAWQQNALFKIYQNGNLSEADIDIFIDICNGTSIDYKYLLEGDIKDHTNTFNEVTLLSINNVVNVNALATNQCLPFRSDGMTIIYGDNGSGKSGYIRILKQICRARNKEIIQKNIYTDTAEPSKAVIKYQVNGKTQESLEWTTAASNSPLSSISIFDTSTATVHVNETNDIAYTPFSIELLMKLADACKRISEKLKTEITTIKAQTPNVLQKNTTAPNTEVGSLLNSLSDTTEISEIDRLSNLSDEEKTRYETLCVDLAVPPQKTIKELNSKLDALHRVLLKKDDILKLADESNYLKVKQLKNAYLQCREVTTLAAAELFNEEPLPGVGSEAWKILWESAKRYSEQIVYLEKKFPNTEGNAKCVLCQQQLEQQAAGRMQRFHAFVTDDTKQRENAANTEYNEFINYINAHAIKIPVIRSITSYVNEQLGNADLALKIKLFFIKTLWRIRAIIRMHFTIPALPSFPREELEREMNKINLRLNSLTNPDAINIRIKLENEKNELEARKYLALIKNDVIAEIDRKKNIKKLEMIIKNQTATDVITRKSTEISKLLVTDALRTRFAQEVDALRISSLAIELQQTNSGHASPQFKVALTRSPKTKVGAILSEGEFRCVAIAAFMAELSTTDNKSAIVFDDPISSLDHTHREAVANRLAKEADNRQVIVFTHNIEFLFYLVDACKKASTEIECQYVTKRPKDSATGLCHRGAPPKAQDVEKRISNIKNRLPNESYHYAEGNETEWNRIVRNMYDDLRYAWERAIEEIIMPVLSRFSNQVTSPGLVKLTCITEENCIIMREAMKRISEWHHSDGIGLNRTLHCPSSIEKEIDILEGWFRDMKAKQNIIKNV